MTRSTSDFSIAYNHISTCAVKRLASAESRANHNPCSDYVKPTRGPVTTRSDKSGRLSETRTFALHPPSNAMSVS